MRKIAATFSFDVVSRVDVAEVVNALNQTAKEIQNRFDFKGSKSGVTLDEKAGQLTLTGDDDYKLSQVNEILTTKLVRRGVSLKNLEYGPIQPAAGGTVRQVVTLRQGIPAEKAKTMTRLIRDSKLKVTAQIQDDQLRVTGAKKDDLQSVIDLLKKEDFGLELQFINYR